jgi:NAD-dependent SIR2 family protein deacetylase
MSNQKLTGVVAVGCRDSELTVLDSAVISSRSLRLVDCENVEIACEDVDLRRIELFRCHHCRITVVGDDILLHVMYVLTREGCSANTFQIGGYLPTEFLPPGLNRPPHLLAAIPDSVDGSQYFTFVPYPNRIASYRLVVDNHLTAEGLRLQQTLSTFTLPTMFGPHDTDLLLAPDKIPTGDDLLSAVSHLESIPYNVTPRQISLQYDLERVERFDDAASMLPKVQEVAALLRQSEYCVVYTGAGVSTSATIPDFRGPQGVWTLKDKGSAMYREFRLRDCKPTFSHYAITALVKRGLVKFVCTTNCDGLHWRTGLPPHLLEELHGSMFSLFCGNCKTFIRRPYEINDDIGHATSELCDWCGSVLLTTGVAFSEDYRYPLEPVITRFHAESADLGIALGSSLCVQSSSMYPIQVVGRGKFVLVNAQKTPVDFLTDVRIFGKTDQFFELLMEELGIGEFDRQTDVLDQLATKSKKNGRKYE